MTRCKVQFKSTREEVCVAFGFDWPKDTKAVALYTFPSGARLLASEAPMIGAMFSTVLFTIFEPAFEEKWLTETQDAFDQFSNEAVVDTLKHIVHIASTQRRFAGVQFRLMGVDEHY